ncbi:hypothetical protein AAC387_Pa04g0682 [Persea americana]
MESRDFSSFIDGDRKKLGPELMKRVAEEMEWSFVEMLMFGGSIITFEPEMLEDYRWRNGCMRSQNQCNDKWDNLMRNYKKVRDHEKKLEEGT